MPVQPEDPAHTMFARRPKIDTTFGIPMDLNQNGLPPSRLDKTASHKAKQAPLVQEGGGWLSRLFKGRQRDTQPTQIEPSQPPRQTSTKPAASWGERGGTYTPRN